MRTFPHFVLSDHAAFELKRRGLEEEVLREILRSPGQVLQVKTGRVVAQSRRVMGGKEYLVRVFVDVDEFPARVVTGYRTSKIAKCWQEEA